MKPIFNDNKQTQLVWDLQYVSYPISKTVSFYDKNVINTLVILGMSDMIDTPCFHGVRLQPLLPRGEVATPASTG